MPAPAKADLEAAVKRLAEENAAMRDLIPAIVSYLTVPSASLDELDEERNYLAGRAAYMRGVFSTPVEDAHSIRARTGFLAKWAEEYPPSYRIVCNVMVGDPGEVGFFCQLDPGHDGDHAPDERKAEPAGSPVLSHPGPKMCPELSDAASFCARLDGHKMPHRDGQGYEWGEDEEPVSAADAIARLNPSAAEVYAAHKGAALLADPFCTCKHKKNLHAGTDADGRCVKRSCGCGQYEAATA